MTETPLVLHELSFVAEGDEVVVGRTDTGSYAVFPADGAALLRRIGEGVPPGQAAEWYEATFEQPVDVEDFVASLQELGFVRDDGEVSAPARAAVRFQRLGRVLLSPVAWFFYACVVAWWLSAVARHSDLAPAPNQIFFTHSLIAVQLVITAGQVPLLLLHECFHGLAGRRLGLPTRLRLSNRLAYIVAETQINGLFSVPRRRRYLAFLAGMGCDCVLVAALGLIADLDRAANGGLSPAGRVCLALGFTVVVRLAWQFQLYLRTDLFYVVGTALNCYDLHDASKALLKNRIWRLLRRPGRLVDERQWTERDRAVGRFYGPFLVLGVTAFITVTALVTVPVSVHYFVTAVRGLASGRLDRYFWDCALSLGFNAAQIAALFLLSRSKRRAWSRRAPHLLAEQEAN